MPGDDRSAEELRAPSTPWVRCCSSRAAAASCSTSSRWSRGGRATITTWAVVRAADTESALAGHERASGSRSSDLAAAAAARAASSEELAPCVAPADRPSCSAGTGVAVPFFVAARLARIPSLWLDDAEPGRRPGLATRICSRLASRVLIQRPTTRAAHLERCSWASCTDGRAGHGRHGPSGRSIGWSSPPRRCAPSTGCSCRPAPPGPCARALRRTRRSCRPTSCPPASTPPTWSSPTPATPCRLVQRAGKVPIAVARRAARGEMGNDHQVAFLRREATGARGGGLGRRPSWSHAVEPSSRVEAASSPNVRCRRWPTPTGWRPPSTQRVPSCCGEPVRAPPAPPLRLRLAALCADVKATTSTWAAVPASSSARSPPTRAAPATASIPMVATSRQLTRCWPSVSVQQVATDGAARLRRRPHSPRCRCSTCSSTWPTRTRLWPRSTGSSRRAACS